MTASILTETLPFGINGVARLFEGEGTIYTTSRHSRSRVRTISMRVQMIDEDVIDALAREFGGAAGHYVRNSTGKPYSQWALTGSRAAILAHRMLPYLFERRRAQVRRAIDEWVDGRDGGDPELEAFMVALDQHDPDEGCPK